MHEDFDGKAADSPLPATLEPLLRRTGTLVHQVCQIKSFPRCCASRCQSSAASVHDWNWKKKASVLGKTGEIRVKGEKTDPGEGD